jgi:xylitol oxidase
VTAGSNWAATHTYAANQILEPNDADELQALVRRGTPLRALGSRHSFNDLADTTGDLVSLGRFDPDLVIDRAGHTATFAAGLKYGDLAALLEAEGWAIHNLASLPHISVAGAIATGTHGSGDANGNLSTAVSAVEFIDGTGEQIRLTRGDPSFDGAVVSLGALGIVTRISLDIEPSFTVRQDLFEGLEWTVALEQFDDITSAAYSVSLFTNWLGDTIDLAWLKSRTDAAAPPETFFGAAPATVNRHMIVEMPSANTTEQLGRPGPWSERLAHFRMGFTPSSGDEIQTEYLVPRARIREALEAIRPLGPDIAPILHVTELRTMAEDSLWLSGAYATPAVGIHFTWKKLPELVLPMVRRLEERLLPLGARPHWGKVFAAQREQLAPLYPRLPDFLDLAKRHDPKGLFRNAFLERTIGL